MILNRFCSEREFAAYMRGETLENHTDHYRGGHGGSTSRGFCFFEGNVTEWSHRLNGLVDFDVLLTVAVDPALVRRSMGIYPDWSKDYGSSIPSGRLYHEFSTETYSNLSFRYVRASKAFSQTFISRSKILEMQRDILKHLSIQL